MMSVYNSRLLLEYAENHVCKVSKLMILHMQGFHRYSTDELWHVPHFEKMLYDQAQLACVYLDAYQVFH